MRKPHSASRVSTPDDIPGCMGSPAAAASITCFFGPLSCLGSMRIFIGIIKATRLPLGTRPQTSKSNARSFYANIIGEAQQAAKARWLRQKLGQDKRAVLQEVFVKSAETRQDSAAGESWRGESRCCLSRIMDGRSISKICSRSPKMADDKQKNHSRRQKSNIAGRPNLRRCRGIALQSCAAQGRRGEILFHNPAKGCLFITGEAGIKNKISAPYSARFSEYSSSERRSLAMGSSKIRGVLYAS